MPFLLAVAIALAPVDARNHLPSQLQRVGESRRAHTSEIEWTITHLTGRDAGLVERHVTRTVDGTVWQVNLGDENGFHKTAYRYVPPDDTEASWRAAEVPREELAGPIHSLVHEGNLWQVEHQKHIPPAAAFVMPVEEAQGSLPFDFTAAGASPSWSPYHGTLGLPERMLEGFETAAYTVVSDGDTEKVKARYNEYALEWELDTTRGGHPIRATFYQNDVPLYSSRTHLTEIDGRWFPTSIRFFTGTAETPSIVIEVQEASFDKPTHVQEITPSDAGLLFGTQILGGEGLQCWDGTQLIPYGDYAELVHVFGMKPDPIIIQRLAEAAGQTVEQYTEYMDKTSEWMRAAYLKQRGEAPWLVKKTGEPDPWDVYVAEFIVKHALDEPRTKRAKDVLEASKKLRDYHLRKNRAAIEEARKEGNAAKLAHYDKLVQRIFDRVLVRGLRALLPREQRTVG